MAGALVLAGCSSGSDWLSLDALQPKPPVEPVRFETEPPGAQIKLPNGQVCLTPCASPLDSSGSYTVEATLNGYQPATATIAPKDMGDGSMKLQPNPVVLQLTPVEKPKRTRRRTTVRKPKPAAPAPKPKPAAAAPAPQQAPSPWPPAQPPQQ